MKVAKYVLTVLSLAVVAGLLFSLLPTDPCQKVLKFSVGRFDKNFALTQDEFISHIKEAEALWEKSLGLDLFQYEPGADFTINLIFDERQRETLLRERTESGLDRAEKIFQNIESAFLVLKKQYEAEEANFNRAKNNYEEEVTQYEKWVSYWNKRGGAPEPEYSELNTKAAELSVQLRALNTDAARLNSLQAEFQKALEKRNLAASEYNKVVESFNQKYGHGYEFDQAEYVGDKINVYQFSKKDDLVLALAHELGHALGMGHVENAQSIMYYQSKEGSDYSLSLSSEDIVEFKRVCNIK